MINIKKLPEIYKNTFSKVINNNKSSYHIKNNDDNTVSMNLDMTNKEINDVIDSIFTSTRYAFNIPVIIKTMNKIYDTSLITKKNGYILTYDRDKIRIDDILSIKIK